ncbi:MAG: membrane-associated protein [Candidatus Omnitrophica bacterium CG11_big_fil_rev_8_21_14_0_20_45_26]|uniref:Membrane-associated protein n=1 Tax=Candidatus Abzuiibacterium crystallinum TaxID=1974748 RepID=A0A2H0LSQ2_9BACT|nr:MAG: membrane-associated protein [Candidatus Omnitrophica bacterium CG11_big_fil_rev_8_21_14_0_20_45_26]PIW64262.1 MAG: membrane-associated protein [Candidatus Omnitrophica bacterium CG12_big_fil_rev_8_21_14_0_65_45_16]
METQKLSVKAFAKASAIVWGGAVLMVGVINLFRPGYGAMFLNMISSVYPGYHADPSIGSVIVGTLYGLVDGAVGGALFAWIYNACLRCCQKQG